MAIGTRIFLGFAMVLALTMGVAAIGWNGLSVYAERVERANRTASLDVTLREARLEEARFVLNAPFEAAVKVRTMTERLKAEAEALGALFTGPDAAAMAEVLQALAAYRKAFDQYVTLEMDKRLSLDRLGKASGDLQAVLKTFDELLAGRYDGAVAASDLGSSDGVARVRFTVGAMGREAQQALVAVRTFLDTASPTARKTLQGAVERLLVLNGEARRGVVGDQDLLKRVDALTPIVFALEQDFLIAGDLGERQSTTLTTMKAAATAVLARVGTVVARGAEEREAGRTTAVELILTGAVGALGLGGVLSVLIARGITRPLTATTATVRELAEGNLAITVPGVGRRDELGAIGRAVAEVIAVLHGLNREMHRLSGKSLDEEAAPIVFKGTYGEMVALLQDTGAAFRDIGDQATQVAVAAGQASTAVVQVSDGALEQTEDLDQVSAAVSQSAAAIAHVSDSTRNASDMVRDAASFAAKGKDEMARLLTVSQTIAENSRRIGRITDAITQIAVKTNILSVNASIEAARAGEQGKGFEVVAEEVGKLADNAVEATRRIQEIIEAAVTLSEEGMGVTEKAWRMMDDLAQRVTTLDRVFQSVAVAMEEQQVSVRDIEANMDSVRLVAQKNAAASEEIAATMRQLSRLADDTRRQVRRFQAVGEAAG